MRQTTAILACLAILALAGCNRGQKAEEAETAKPAAPPVRTLAALDIVTAKVGTVSEAVPFTGTLNPEKSSQVAARAEGTVQSVSVREGQTVRRGEVLAVIDSETLRQSVIQQEAQLANNRARLRLSQQKLHRQRELVERGFISRLAFEELQSDYAVSEGEVRAQAAELARARQDLAEAVVKAPLDGVVYQKKINVGDVAARNTVLFAVADLSVLEVEATLPAQRAASVNVGQTARFKVEGGSTVFQGRVTRLNPVAAPGTRSFTAYVRVDNRDARLKAGQFVQGDIVLRELPEAVSLPQAAVREADKSPWVMVVRNGRLEKRPVEILLTADTTRTVAVKGLNAGEVVLSANLIGMKPGDAVRLPSAG